MQCEEHEGARIPRKKSSCFSQHYTQPQNIPSIEQQGSTRGQGPPVMDSAIFLPFRQKDSPWLQHRNKGLSCRVRFHHQNLLLFSFPAVCRGFALHADSDRRKEHAFARFRTTACRLRNDRTLSASGRFSTSDSPPSIALGTCILKALPLVRGCCSSLVSTV